ncbi:hypothetical protein MNBD_GAMMA23-2187 [hydrothermal vent metagenome]|uniref:D,D-heptose 1,7-bisphosphate phosphatase n=1 Tax=hydrothermal vent metagenome TaxID=652676 RepID=A0A3B1A1Y9_9ZZZZ
MKFIILDRDGVINQDSDDYIKSPEEFIPLEGSLAAIAKLKQAEYRVVVATNQSGIARELYDLDTLHRIHDKLNRLLQSEGTHLDGIFYCPHGPDDNCHCRKPKPGMYLDIAKRFNIDLTETTVVGDSLRDLQAAITVQAKPILVRTGKGERTIKKHAKEISGIPVYESLADFVNSILK